MSTMSPSVCRLTHCQHEDGAISFYYNVSHYKDTPCIVTISAFLARKRSEVLAIRSLELYDIIMTSLGFHFSFGLPLRREFVPR